MAQLYMGDLIRGERYMATACSRPGQYGDATDFMQAVNAWMDRHNIQYRWEGHATHTCGSCITYYYTVCIANDEHRTFFTLRWS